MGLTLTFDRAEGRQGISLAALAAAVEQSMQEAARLGIDPDTVEPTARMTMRGKITKVEVRVQ